MVPVATAQKTVPFHVIECQVAETGNVRCVHVIPSGLVAAMALPVATAQKTVPFHAIEYQLAETGNVRCVHNGPWNTQSAGTSGADAWATTAPDRK